MTSTTTQQGILFSCAEIVQGILVKIRGHLVPLYRISGARVSMLL